MKKILTILLFASLGAGSGLLASENTKEDKADLAEDPEFKLTVKKRDLKAMTDKLQKEVAQLHRKLEAELTKYKNDNQGKIKKDKETGKESFMLGSGQNIKPGKPGRIEFIEKVEVAYSGNAIKSLSFVYKGIHEKEWRTEDRQITNTNIQDENLGSLVMTYQWGGPNVGRYPYISLKKETDKQKFLQAYREYLIRFIHGLQTENQRVLTTGRRLFDEVVFSGSAFR